ncbi:cellulose binding domain-containing protein [Catellatospora tritici]|uniref:cellulose binding domain-containing protein n=1 Tax=Catellatospora tritici TaxID=2851566 RepID=UPI001C2D9642|nr:cellulose binding domain-containing protein [Catellatospora tritici]MBV1855830.1 cellulose binding domain-containing protein [Catellatospora tritici]
MNSHSLPRLLGLAMAVVVAATVAASPATAATPLPTPGMPVATQVTQTSITITWAAVAGPVKDYTIQVIDGPLVPWYDLAHSTTTSFTHSGLTPDKVYEYRVIANAQANSGYTTSSPSGYNVVTTAPLPDSIPPTKPATPFAYSVSTVAATINTNGSTDNNRVAGYWVQRQVNGVWTDWATNSVGTVYLNNLTPSTTYTVVVVAFDPNGNRSVRSDPVTFTTRAIQPTPTCRNSIITYGTQFTVTVTVENMTASTVLQNWTVTFTLPTADVLGGAFNATVTRAGDQATATPAFYVATINPGGAATFGFSATAPAGSPPPSRFALNGTIPCVTA